MTITGHCYCGQLQYSSNATPIGSRICWCRDCQYLACGSGTVNLLLPFGSVNFEGDVTHIRSTADSGNEIERSFCPQCGTHVYATTVGLEMPVRIRAGTLDNPDIMAPQAVIWTQSAPEWAVFDPAIPHYPKAAPPAQ